MVTVATAPLPSESSRSLPPVLDGEGLIPAGVATVDRVQVSADGSAYVYSNRRVISQLVLAEQFD